MHATRNLTLLAGTALAAVAVASCGSSVSTSSSPSKASRRPTVASAHTRLGEVLVDPSGRTLDLFKQDRGTRTTCFSSCARAWPPLRATHEPRAGGNAKTSLLGTTKRPDGPAQVTYDGHPLYLYQNDVKPGDVTGQGVDVWGDVWWVVSPSGKQVTKGGRKKPGEGY